MSVTIPEPISRVRRLHCYWPILAYHSISDARSDGLSISTGEFEAHLRALRDRGIESATLEELLDDMGGRGTGRRASRRVVITFDDGYRDNHTHAMPLLRRYGYTATFFVVTDLIGTDRLQRFDLEKPRQGFGPASSYALMNWEEVRDLAANGMQIGSHTCTHIVLDRTVSDSVLDAEVVKSRDEIESQLNRKADLFCYPRGRSDQRAYQALSRAGYRAAVVTPGLRDGLVETRYTLKRIGLYRSGLMRFRLKITPAFYRLRCLGALQWA
jgi:peptidoglycan/xylan/chitin deacetylase (PgdA/CDA1 family)